MSVVSKPKQFFDQEQEIGSHFSFYSPVDKKNNPIYALPKNPPVYGDLRQLAVLKTKQYLTKDNPPKNEKKFFTCHGKKGRDRAKDYFDHTLMIYNGDELLTHLVYDINHTFKINSLYRTRLLEAICQYFGISEFAITQQTKEIVIASAAYTGYGDLTADFNQTRISVMESIVRSKTAYVQPPQKENPTFDFENEQDRSLYRI